MKKLFTTLLCVSLAIPVIAGGPRLSRSDLGNVTVIEKPVPKATTMMAEAKSTPSLQQFMRERDLTLRENRLSNRSPRRITIEELEGVRIASSDAYNFEWDSSNQIAIVDESSCALMGCYSLITCSPGTGDVYLSFYYDEFEIPIEINAITDSVTIKAGLPLASTSTIESSDLWPIRKADNVVVVWTLYAMPLNWLEGDDDYADIHGVVETDGTITFNDDFAFLIKAKIQGEERGSYLSPIFKNLTLLRPNGSHSFTYSRINADESGFGHGSLVPRKPGKPVSPRPISSIIGANNPSFNSNRFSKIMLDTHLLHLKELQSVVGPVCLPDGHGKLGPRKPTSWGPFNDIVNCRGPETDTNPVLRTGSGGSIDPDIIITQEQVPVYVYMPNDTMLMVYNLFGLGNRCYMEVNKLDGSMRLPVQEIYNDGLGDVYYNDERTGQFGTNSIYWSHTIMYDNYGNDMNRKFDFNHVYYTDSLPPKPTFAKIVTSTQVRISAFVREPYKVHLYRYDVETDSYTEIEGSNSVVLARKNEPYWVYLKAQAYDPFSYVCSETVWFEYEVPALASNLRGDVNNDGAVSISDVTAMIDGLLSGNWDGKNYDNADCNLNGEVSISDVTSLIDYLLSGTWAE